MIYIRQTKNQFYSMFIYFLHNDKIYQAPIGEKFNRHYTTYSYYTHDKFSEDENNSLEEMYNFLKKVFYDDNT